MTCPQFYSRKNTQVLAGCAQTRRFSSRSSPPSSTTRTLPGFPLSPHHPTTANVCLSLVCVLPDFPLLGVNGFLFCSRAIWCVSGNSLFALEFLTRPSSQKSIHLISAALASLIAISSGLGHSWQIRKLFGSPCTSLRLRSSSRHSHTAHLNVKCISFAP